MVDTAIFLGAGASKAEGAPRQGELFADYFSSPSFRRSRGKMDRELAAFFSEMFGLDVRHGDLANINFPTFEPDDLPPELAALPLNKPGSRAAR